MDRLAEFEAGSGAVTGTRAPGGMSRHGAVERGLAAAAPRWLNGATRASFGAAWDDPNETCEL